MHTFVCVLHTVRVNVPLKCPFYAILKIPNFVLEVSYNIFTCIKGSFSYNIHCTSYFSESGNSLFEDSVSLNLSFFSDWSVMAQSVMIGLSFESHVENETPIIQSEFQLRKQ